MSRRTTLALSGAVVAALALAAASEPWTIAAPRAAAFAERDLARRYGLGLVVTGSATLTLLPAPRLTFTEVRLHRGTHDLVASEGLQVQLGLAGLLAGRPEITGLVLDRARIALPDGAGSADAGSDWAEPAARLAARVAAGRGRHLRRLVLIDTTLTGRDPRTGTRETVTGLNLVANWPRPSAGLDLSAGFTWRGVPATLTLSDLRPRELAAGTETPVTAALAWSAAGPGSAEARAAEARTIQGSAEIEGSLVWTRTSSEDAAGAGPRLSGRGRFATPSLPGTLAWLGITPGPAALAGPVSLDGRFAARPGAVEWPELQVRVGDSRLEGAGAAALVRGRLSLTATLAAERLDLSGLVPEPEPGGAWSRAPLALDGLTRGDIDLRLSAASARLGPVEAQDVAAGLLVRDGTVEATLGRATVQGGTVKGRAALAALPAGLDARIQGSADRIDLGGLFADLGWPRWILGRAQGSVALDSAGSSLADLVGRLAGRAAATVEGGEILGLSLADIAQKPESAAALRRGGRTHFERARVSLTVSDGVAEIGQGQVRGGGLTASLGGRVFLAERRLGAEARIEPGPDGRAGAFAIEGPWLRPTLRPLGGRLLDRALPAETLPAAASAYAP